jgi:SPASM domain peptide maturase of grasp-with-spasm system
MPKKIVNILDKNLFCSAFEIVSWKEIIYNDLCKILELFDDTRNIYHVDIITKYNKKFQLNNIKKIAKKYFIVNRFVAHSAPYDFTENSDHTSIIYTTETLNEKSECGKISKNYLSLNLQHITEAKNHNSCLHKKISIDKNGSVKNCPFTSETLGKILDDDILEKIQSKHFQKLWHITKDQIKVCKNCEFRYICTDCRVFVKDKNDIYSQPAKCTYNPYIAKWQGEEGYISVEQSLKKLETAK